MHGDMKNMQAKFNGQKVRTLRKMKKLSQAMLAEQGDTSERYIRDLERGQKRNPSAPAVCSLSRTLGLAAIDELMGITEEDCGE